MNENQTNTKSIGKVQRFIEVRMMEFRIVRFLTTAAVIAALYAGLVFAPVLSAASFYGNQVRIAEALTVLPFFTPAAIPGIFIGCLIANTISPLGPLDMIMGSLVSLLAAILSRKLPNWLGITNSNSILTKLIVPLPPVILNAVYVAYIWKMLAGEAFVPIMISVAIGEMIACYGLGVPVMLAFTKIKKIIKI